MTHEFHGTLREARRKHPHAMILRLLPDGRVVVFDSVLEAFGHPTTTYGG